MQKPNVIYILADDMGYGDFSRFNQGLSSTPVLDGLIDEGVSLTQYYSASPICAPARAAFLTGRYPHRTGAIETRELRGLCNLAIRETTIADFYKRSGYSTGLIGKWHNGCLQKRFSPNARGFDEFIGFRSGWQDYYEWVLDRNGQHEKSDGRYLTDVFTEEAIGFIERHRDEPFFLHLAYNAPHTPLQAPESAVRPFADKGAFTEAVSTIYGMNHRMDAGIGRLLEKLDETGLSDNTLIVFTSDNGPQFGGKGEQSTVRFNCDFNGEKGKVYEGGIRVPAILRWPAGLPTGEAIGDMIHGCDWLPTLTGMCDVDRSGGMPLDGIDASSILRGESSEMPDERFWQWNRYDPMIETNAAVRAGDWKLVRPAIKEASWTDPEEQKLDSAFREAPWGDYDPIVTEPDRIPIPAPPQPELYNIANDPCEQNDLAATDPVRVRRMMSSLESWFEDVEADRRSIGGPWAEGAS
jgi:arylsulfatase A-like enzyme